MDPRRLLPALAALACACVVAVVVVRVGALVPRGEQAVETTAPPARSASAVGSGASAVLAEWDAARAAAWSEGDVASLERLYVAGSRAGAADVRLLRDYLDRGLTVDHLATQVLTLRVVERAPHRLVLVVTDRIAGGEVVADDGTRRALPADRASTRQVELVRRDGRWLVAEVRDQASAAASTSRTSSSSKS